MIPLGTLVTITSQGGTELTNRFNLLRSVEFNGVPGRGYASGQALAALEATFKETMPPEMGFTYSSLSYQEKIAPPAAPTLVAAIVFVFLLLAAMYESWRLPWAVLLGSPLVALGAFFGVWLVGYDNNVYVQIGNIMLIGLAAKNAILIVEFAKAKHDQEGMGFEEAALESARLRFRPILMTAFAFILGVIPLMRASGAGAGAQNVMGTAVFCGMLVATALGVFLIPGNYAFVETARPQEGGYGRGPAAASRRRPTGEPTDGAAGWQPSLSPSSPAAARSVRTTSGRRSPFRPPGARSRWPRPRASPTRRGGSSSTIRSSRSSSTIALVENKDLKIAVERIEEARARYGFTKADLWPKFDANVTAGRLRFNSGSLIHTPEGDQAAVTQGTETPIYSISADVSWEIDFFGRIRRATEAQKALFLGTQEARRSAVLTLVADVARTYFELRDADLRLEIARRTIQSRRESVQYAKDRFEGGVTPELDFRQAEAELKRVETVALRPGALHLRQGERALGAAGPQPRTGPARPDRERAEAPGRRARRAALRAPRAAPRHPRGRADARRRHGQHRRGQGDAVPAHRPHRLLRHRQHRLRHALRGSEQVLEHHRQPPAADLPLRQEQAPGRDHGVAPAAGALRLRAHDPGGLPRDRGRAHGLPQDGRAAPGPGRPRGGRSQGARAQPSCATRAASPPTSRCSTPSARSSRRSSTRPRRSAANLVSLVRLYKALGGGWPSAPEPTSGPPPSPPPPPSPAATPPPTP